MADIPRDPGGLAGESFDLIIVGGGIYGAMTLLEAARVGLRALMLERDDFGGATSSNHFRIGHGGLRYLQSLDLARFRESVRERRWLLRTFPELVQPLRCVMPLYGEGLRRPGVMRLALAANDLLSLDRNRGVVSERALPSAEVIGSNKVRELFPRVRTAALDGAAVWYDAEMVHANRILIETLRWACAHGGAALNYVGVRQVLTSGGMASGVVAFDRASDREFRYAAPAIVNATGPGAREFAMGVDRDHPELFRKSRAWNVVFDRPPVGEGALAVTGPGAGTATYFLKSCGGRLFAGTGHAPCEDHETDPRPSEAELAHFIDDLNRAVPGIELSPNGVAQVQAGFLPVRRTRTVDLADRPILIDHGGVGGLRGFYSVSGVKYTTARKVAEKLIRQLRSGLARKLGSPRFAYDRPWEARTDFRVSTQGDRWRQTCERIIREESVLRLDDLVERRTDLAEHPQARRKLGEELEALVLRSTPSFS